MSKDIIRGTLISVAGVGLYGLYYGWKVHRAREFMKAETEVTLSDYEKMCIAFMRDTDMPKKLLSMLRAVVLERFGYDLAKERQSEQLDSSIWQNYDSFLEYFNFIQQTKEFYDTQRASTQSGTFLAEWFDFFHPTGQSMPHGIEANEENVIELLLKVATLKLQEMINTCMESDEANTDDMKGQWRDDESIFFNFLKEKKCINIDYDADQFRNTYWIETLM